MTTDTSTLKQFQQVTPVLVAQDIPQTIAYYEHTLGFAKAFEFGSPVMYAGMTRDGFDFHFNAPCSDTPAPPHNSQGVDVYVTVADVDGLYGELIVRGANVLHGPANQDYGMRDFYVEDCNGYRLGFAQPLSCPPSTETDK